MAGAPFVPLQNLYPKTGWGRFGVILCKTGLFSINLGLWFHDHLALNTQYVVAEKTNKYFITKPEWCLRPDPEPAFSALSGGRFHPELAISTSLE